jgi:hypothetical protein
MRTFMLLVGGLAVALVASSAGAAPIIDGNVLLGEYATVVHDAAGETYAGNLDIDTFQFDASNAYYNVAVTVVAPPLDKTGGVTSPIHQTEFWTLFKDSTGTTDLYAVDIVMNSFGVLMFTLGDYTAGSLVPLAPGDYSVSVGNALEFRIDKSKMPLLPASPYVVAQLDNRGQAPDDQISTGPIPEPATLALLSLGAVAALAARRRK